jgi:hypothetical protein
MSNAVKAALAHLFTPDALSCGHAKARTRNTFVYKKQTVHRAGFDRVGSLPHQNRSVPEIKDPDKYAMLPQNTVAMAEARG